MLCSKHADAQTALFKFHRYVFENVKCTVVCVLAGGGGGGGGGGDGPVFVSLFVFWIPRRATRLFVNGFRYFFFHPFRSIILPLPHKTHLHFTKILKKS